MTIFKTYAILIRSIGFIFLVLSMLILKEGTMSVMKEMKNVPKFSAKAVSVAENGRPYLFVPILILAFVAAGTIEKGSLLVGIIIGVITIAVAAYALPKRLLGGGW